MVAPAPLRRPAFRAVWLGGLVSDAGDWMLLVALPIVVYTLTGSALGTSAAFLAELAPGVVLAPLAGRLADRLDRRRLMIGLAVAQAAMLSPLLLVHGRSGLPVVYAVIIVQAALGALFDPAKNALLPELVTGDELVSANSLVGLGAAIGRIAGGPLGGLLLAAGDLHTIVVADGASFLLAAALIVRADPAAAHRAHRTETPVGAPAPRGFLAALDDARVRRALLVAVVASVAQGIFVVLFIIFVAQRLRGGAGEIGLLRGIQAVGAIAAGLTLALAPGRREPGRLVAVAVTAFGAISLLVWNLPAVTTAGAVYVILFIAVGAPGVAFEAGLLSLLAQATAPDRRGRVMGAAGLAENAGQAVGMLAAGGLTGLLGLTAMLDLQAGIYLAAGGLAALTLAALRPGAADASRGDRVRRSTSPADLAFVRRIELAAVDGWPASITRAGPGGWLLRATPGLDRARSNHALTPCRPLHGDELAPALAAVQAFAAEHAIPAGVQISPDGLHGPLEGVLDDRGWTADPPVVVMTGPGRISAPALAEPVAVADRVDQRWLATWVRCSPREDAAAHAETVFAALAGRARFVRLGDAAVVLGVPSAGAIGIFCLAVDPNRRRAGLGRAIVTALLNAETGCELSYAQVQSGNTAARSLYAGLGFGEAYRYRHRRAP